MTTPDIIRAHRHSIYHRQEVLSSEHCGCFYCLAIFSPDCIVNWTDSFEGVGQTVLCPRCGIDAVIGTESGYPITLEFLQLMRSYWF